MLQIKPSKKSLACQAAVAVFLLVIGGFAYWDLAGKHGLLSKQITGKEQRLANSEQITRRLFAVEQDYMNAQAKLGALEHGVSTRSYVPTLLRQIEVLGGSVNMRVVGVRPRIVVEAPPPPASSTDEKGVKKIVRAKPDPYNKLDIDIEVKGKYADVMRFVYKITSFPKIIAVNSMQMTPAGGQREELASPVLSVRLWTTAFILKESADEKADAGRVGADQRT